MTSSERTRRTLELALEEAKRMVRLDGSPRWQRLVDRLEAAVAEAGGLLPDPLGIREKARVLYMRGDRVECFSEDGRPSPSTVGVIDMSLDEPRYELEFDDPDCQLPKLVTAGDLRIMPGRRLRA